MEPSREAILGDEEAIGFVYGQWVWAVAAFSEAEVLSARADGTERQGMSRTKQRHCCPAPKIEKKRKKWKLAQSNI